MKEFKLKTNFQASLLDIPKVLLYHSKKDKEVPFKHLKFYEGAFKTAIVHALPGKEHVFTKGLPALVRDIKSIT